MDRGPGWGQRTLSEMIPAPNSTRPVLMAALGAGMLACASEPRVGPEQPASVAAGTFGEIEARILVPRCATSACHSGNPPANAPLSLDPGAGWAQMVGVPASQLPSMKLVEPGDAEGSYLVLKLRGTAGLAGGTGTLMPPDAPLDAAEQAAIEGWISSGALND